MSENKNWIKRFFSGLGRWIKRHKGLSIFLLILILLISLIFYIVAQAKKAFKDLMQPEIITLEKVDLENFVSSLGTLQSASKYLVNSTLTYDVSKVNVKVGDKVNIGQILAELDSSELDANIEEVRKSISEAEKLDQVSLRQAKRSLAEAEQNLNLNQEKNNRAVQEAIVSVEAANQKYAETSFNYESVRQVLDTAIKFYLNADYLEKSSLLYTRENMAYYFKLNPEWFIENQLLEMIEIDLQPYLTNYLLAESKYLEAENKLKIDEATYKQAVETMDLSLRADQNVVKAAQDAIEMQQVKQSSSSLKSQLQKYIEAKEKTILASPITGTVTEVNAKVGNSAGSLMAPAGNLENTLTATGALFVIEDTEHLEVTAVVPEYDMTNLHAGMMVKITTDALKGEWQGSVKNISPKAVNNKGDFTVVVQVTSTLNQLTIGMGAKLNIVTESKPQVFAVPYDTLSTNSEGKTVIYQQLDGPKNLEAEIAKTTQSDAEAATKVSPKKSLDPRQGNWLDQRYPQIRKREIVVETGLETDYYVEIISSEIKAGMKIFADPEGKNEMDLIPSPVSIETQGETS